LRCDEFPALVELSLAERVVTVEIGISESLYFFHEVVEALLDLGAVRCGSDGTVREEQRRRRMPMLWRERRWSERFCDRHPIVVGVLMIVFAVPRALSGGPEFSRATLEPIGRAAGACYRRGSSCRENALKASSRTNPGAGAPLWRRCEEARTPGRASRA
jgi:hypothetical protein